MATYLEAYNQLINDPTGASAPAAPATDPVVGVPDDGKSPLQRLLGTTKVFEDKRDDPFHHPELMAAAEDTMKLTLDDSFDGAGQLRHLNVFGKIMTREQLEASDVGKSLIDIAMKNREGPAGLWEGITRGGVMQLVPYLNDVHAIGMTVKQTSDTFKTFQKLNSGEATSDEEMIGARLFLADGERQAQQTGWALFGSIAAQAPAFAGEILTSALVGSAIKKGAKKAIGEVLEQGTGALMMRESRKLGLSIAKKQLAGVGDDVALKVANEGAQALAKKLATKGAIEATESAGEKTLLGTIATLTTSMADEAVALAAKASKKPLTAVESAYVRQAATDRMTKEVTRELAYLGKGRAARMMHKANNALIRSVVNTIDPASAGELAADEGFHAGVRKAARLLYTGQFTGVGYLAADELVHAVVAPLFGVDRVITPTELQLTASGVLQQNQSLVDNARALSLGMRWAEYYSEMVGGALTAVGKGAAKSLMRSPGGKEVSKSAAGRLVSLATRSIEDMKEGARMWSEIGRMHSGLSINEISGKGVRELAETVVLARSAQPGAAALVGEALTKAIEAEAKIIERGRSLSTTALLLSRFMQKTGVGPKEATDYLRRIGYHGVAEELGEESFNNFIQGLYGLNDTPAKAGVWDNLDAAFRGAASQFDISKKEFWAQAAAFALPAVARHGLMTTQTALYVGPRGILKQVHDRDSAIRSTRGYIVNEKVLNIGDRDVSIASLSPITPGAVNEGSLPEYVEQILSPGGIARSVNGTIDVNSVLTMPGNNTDGIHEVIKMIGSVESGEISTQRRVARTVANVINLALGGGWRGSTNPLLADAYRMDPLLGQQLQSMGVTYESMLAEKRRELNNDGKTDPGQSRAAAAAAIEVAAKAETVKQYTRFLATQGVVYVSRSEADAVVAGLPEADRDNARIEYIQSLSDIAAGKITLTPAEIKQGALKLLESRNIAKPSAEQVASASAEYQKIREDHAAKTGLAYSRTPGGTYYEYALGGTAHADDSPMRVRAYLRFAERDAVIQRPIINGVVSPGLLTKQIDGATQEQLALVASENDMAPESDALNDLGDMLGLTRDRFPNEVERKARVRQRARAMLEALNVMADSVALVADGHGYLFAKKGVDGKYYANAGKTGKLPDGVDTKTSYGSPEELANKLNTLQKDAGWRADEAKVYLVPNIHEYSSDALDAAVYLYENKYSNEIFDASGDLGAMYALFGEEIGRYTNAYTDHRSRGGGTDATRARLDAARAALYAKHNKYRAAQKLSRGGELTAQEEAALFETAPARVWLRDRLSLEDNSAVFTPELKKEYAASLARTFANYDMGLQLAVAKRGVARRTVVSTGEKAWMVSAAGFNNRSGIYLTNRNDTSVIPEEASESVFVRQRALVTKPRTGGQYTSAVNEFRLDLARIIEQHVKMLPADGNPEMRQHYQVMSDIANSTTFTHELFSKMLSGVVLGNLEGEAQGYPALNKMASEIRKLPSYPPFLASMEAMFGGDPANSFTKLTGLTKSWSPDGTAVIAATNSLSSQHDAYLGKLTELTSKDDAAKYGDLEGAPWDAVSTFVHSTLPKRVLRAEDARIAEAAQRKQPVKPPTRTDTRPGDNLDKFIPADPPVGGDSLVDNRETGKARYEPDAADSLQPDISDSAAKKAKRMEKILAKEAAGTELTLAELKLLTKRTERIEKALAKREAGKELTPAETSLLADVETRQLTKALEKKAAGESLTPEEEALIAAVKSEGDEVSTGGMPDMDDANNYSLATIAADGRQAQAMLRAAAHFFADISRNDAKIRGLGMDDREKKMLEKAAQDPAYLRQLPITELSDYSRAAMKVLSTWDPELGLKKGSESIAVANTIANAAWDAGVDYGWDAADLYSVSLEVGASNKQEVLAKSAGFNAFVNLAKLVSPSTRTFEHAGSLLLRLRDETSEGSLSTSLAKMLDPAGKYDKGELNPFEDEYAYGLVTSELRAVDAEEHPMLYSLGLAMSIMGPTAGMTTLPYVRSHIPAAITTFTGKAATAATYGDRMRQSEFEGGDYSDDSGSAYDSGAPLTVGGVARVEVSSAIPRPSVGAQEVGVAASQFILRDIVSAASAEQAAASYLATLEGAVRKLTKLGPANQSTDQRLSAKNATELVAKAPLADVIEAVAGAFDAMLGTRDNMISASLRDKRVIKRLTVPYTSFKVDAISGEKLRENFLGDLANLARAATLGLQTLQSNLPNIATWIDKKARANSVNGYLSGADHTGMMRRLSDSLNYSLNDHAATSDAALSSGLIGPFLQRIAQSGYKSSLSKMAYDGSVTTVTGSMAGMPPAAAEMIRNLPAQYFVPKGTSDAEAEEMRRLMLRDGLYPDGTPVASVIADFALPRDNDASLGESMVYFVNKYLRDEIAGRPTSHPRYTVLPLFFGGHSRIALNLPSEWVASKITEENKEAALNPVYRAVLAELAPSLAIDAKRLTAPQSMHMNAPYSGVATVSVATPFAADGSGLDYNVEGFNGMAIYGGKNRGLIKDHYVSSKYRVFIKSAQSQAGALSGAMAALQALAEKKATEGPSILTDTSAAKVNPLFGRHAPRLVTNVGGMTAGEIIARGVTPQLRDAMEVHAEKGGSIPIEDVAKLFEAVGVDIANVKYEAGREGPVSLEELLPSMSVDLVFPGKGATAILATSFQAPDLEMRVAASLAHKPEFTPTTIPSNVLLNTLSFGHDAYRKTVDKVADMQASVVNALSDALEPESLKRLRQSIVGELDPIIGAALAQGHISWLDREITQLVAPRIAARESHKRNPVVNGGMPVDVANGGVVRTHNRGYFVSQVSWLPGSDNCFPDIDYSMGDANDFFVQHSVVFTQAEQDKVFHGLNRRLTMTRANVRGRWVREGMYLRTKIDGRPATHMEVVNELAERLTAMHEASGFPGVYLKKSAEVAKLFEAIDGRSLFINPVTKSPYYVDELDKLAGDPGVYNLMEAVSFADLIIENPNKLGESMVDYAAFYFDYTDGGDINMSDGTWDAKGVRRAVVGGSLFYGERTPSAHAASGDLMRLGQPSSTQRTTKRSTQSVVDLATGTISEYASGHPFEPTNDFAITKTPEQIRNSGSDTDGDKTPVLALFYDPVTGAIISDSVQTVDGLATEIRAGIAAGESERAAFTRVMAPLFNMATRARNTAVRNQSIKRYKTASFRDFTSAAIEARAKRYTFMLTEGALPVSANIFPREYAEARFEKRKEGALEYRGNEAEFTTLLTSGALDHLLPPGTTGVFSRKELFDAWNRQAKNGNFVQDALYHPPNPVAHDDLEGLYRLSAEIDDADEGRKTTVTQGNRFNLINTADMWSLVRPSREGDTDTAPPTPEQFQRLLDWTMHITNAAFDAASGGLISRAQLPSNLLTKYFAGLASRNWNSDAELLAYHDAWMLWASSAEGKEAAADKFRTWPKTDAWKRLRDLDRDIKSVSRLTHRSNEYPRSAEAVVDLERDVQDLETAVRENLTGRGVGMPAHVKASLGLIKYRLAMLKEAYTGAIELSPAYLSYINARDAAKAKRDMAPNEAAYKELNKIYMQFHNPSEFKRRYNHGLDCKVAAAMLQGSNPALYQKLLDAELTTGEFILAVEAAVQSLRVRINLPVDAKMATEWTDNTNRPLPQLKGNRLIGALSRPVSFGAVGSEAKRYLYTGPLTASRLDFSTDIDKIRDDYATLAATPALVSVMLSRLGKTIENDKIAPVITELNLTPAELLDMLFLYNAMTSTSASMKPGPYRGFGFVFPGQKWHEFTSRRSLLQAAGGPAMSHMYDLAAFRTNVVTPDGTLSDAPHVPVDVVGKNSYFGYSNRAKQEGHVFPAAMKHTVEVYSRTIEKVTDAKGKIELQNVEHGAGAYSDGRAAASITSIAHTDISPELSYLDPFILEQHMVGNTPVRTLGRLPNNPGAGVPAASALPELSKKAMADMSAAREALKEAQAGIDKFLSEEHTTEGISEAISNATPKEIEELVVARPADTNRMAMPPVFTDDRPKNRKVAAAAIDSRRVALEVAAQVFSLSREEFDAAWGAPRRAELVEAVANRRGLSTSAHATLMEILDTATPTSAEREFVWEVLSSANAAAKLHSSLTSDPRESNKSMVSPERLGKFVSSRLIATADAMISGADNVIETLMRANGDHNVKYRLKEGTRSYRVTTVLGIAAPYTGISKPGAAQQGTDAHSELGKAMVTPEVESSHPWVEATRQLLVERFPLEDFYYQSEKMTEGINKVAVGSLSGEIDLIVVDKKTGESYVIDFKPLASEASDYYQDTPNSPTRIDKQSAQVLTYQSMLRSSGIPVAEKAYIVHYTRDLTEAPRLMEAVVNEKSLALASRVLLHASLELTDQIPGVLDDIDAVLGDAHIPQFIKDYGDQRIMAESERLANAYLSDKHPAQFTGYNEAYAALRTMLRWNDAIKSPKEMVRVVKAFELIQSAVKNALNEAKDRGSMFSFASLISKNVYAMTLDPPVDQSAMGLRFYYRNLGEGKGKIIEYLNNDLLPQLGPNTENERPALTQLRALLEAALHCKYTLAHYYTAEGAHAYYAALNGEEGELSPFQPEHPPVDMPWVADPDTGLTDYDRDIPLPRRLITEADYFDSVIMPTFRGTPMQSIVQNKFHEAVTAEYADRGSHFDIMVGIDDPEYLAPVKMVPNVMIFDKETGETRVPNEEEKQKVASFARKGASYTLTNKGKKTKDQHEMLDWFAGKAVKVALSGGDSIVLPVDLASLLNTVNEDRHAVFPTGAELLAIVPGESGESKLINPNAPVSALAVMVTRIHDAVPTALQQPLKEAVASAIDSARERMELKAREAGVELEANGESLARMEQMVISRLRATGWAAAREGASYRTNEDSGVPEIERRQCTLAVPLSAIDSAFHQDTELLQLLSESGRDLDMYNIEKLAETIRKDFYDLHGALVASTPGFLSSRDAQRLYSFRGIIPFQAGGGVFRRFSSDKVERYLLTTEEEIDRLRFSLDEVLKGGASRSKLATRVHLPGPMVLLFQQLTGETGTGTEVWSKLKSGAYASLGVPVGASMEDLAKTIHNLALRKVADLALTSDTSIQDPTQTAEGFALGTILEAFGQASNKYGWDVDMTGLSDVEIYEKYGYRPASIGAGELLAKHAEDMARGLQHKYAINTALMQRDAMGSPLIYALPSDIDDDTVIGNGMWNTLAHWWAESNNWEYDTSKTGRENAKHFFNDYIRPLMSDDASHVTYKPNSQMIDKAFRSMKSTDLTSVPEFAVRLGLPGQNTAGWVATAAGGEHVAWMAHLLQANHVPDTGTVMGGYDWINTRAKAMAMSLSLFHLGATAWESSAALQGTVSTLTGIFTPETMRAFGKTGLGQAMNVTPNSVGQNDIMRMQLTNDPWFRDVRRIMSVIGVKMSTRTSNPAGVDNSVLRKDMSKLIKWAEKNGVPMAGPGGDLIKRGLYLFNENQTEWTFQYVANAVKASVALNLITRLRNEALEKGRIFDPVQVMRRWAPYVNAEIGGIDPVMYPMMNPKALVWWKRVMLSWQWSFGAWEAAGGGALTGAITGFRLHPDVQSFMPTRWARMLLGVMYGVPFVFQTLIKGISVASGYARDDDEWLIWKNEPDRKNSFNISPLLRMLGDARAITWAKDNLPLGGAIPASIGDDPTQGDRKYYMHFGKQGWEIMRYFADPFGNVFSKLALPVQRGYQAITGGTPNSKFDLPFKGKSWTSSAGERFVYLLGMVEPMSFSSWERNKDVGFLTMVGPVTKGVSATGASDKIREVLETYADPKHYNALLNSPNYWNDYEAQVQPYLKAAAANGHSADMILKDAKRTLLTKYYREVYSALPNRETGELDEVRLATAFASLQRLNFVYGNLLKSVSTRDERNSTKGNLTEQVLQTRDLALREAFWYPDGRYEKKYKRKLPGERGSSTDARYTRQAAKGGNVAELLATDELPEAVFGYDIVPQEDLTDDDLEFFAQNPESPGFFQPSNDPMVETPIEDAEEEITDEGDE